MSSAFALLIQGSLSTEYDILFWSMSALCGAVGTGIAAFLIYSAWRYRRRNPDELPPQLGTNYTAEATWIILTFLFFMAMFFFGTKLYFNIYTPPESSEEVYVVARQWMWKTQHLDGTREINSLHVPVGRSIRLNMISQDVIHSFFVPAFRIKQDVLPGRYTTVFFRAVRPGRYRLFCAEYCGTDHSRMDGWIYALDPREYQRWLEQGAAEGSLASVGAKLFQQFGCANCHNFAGHGPCPNLRGVYGRQVRLTGGGIVIADETYIRESILNPRAKIVEGFQPIMPTFQGQLTEDQLIALIAFIRAIGPQPGAENASSAGGAGEAGVGPGTAEQGAPALSRQAQGPR